MHVLVVPDTLLHSDTDPFKDVGLFSKPLALLGCISNRAGAHRSREELSVPHSEEFSELRSADAALAEVGWT